MESTSGRHHPHHGAVAHDHDRDVGRFDRWSASYDRSVFQPLFFKRVHRLILGILGPRSGQSVLDVGCGTGSLAALIRATGASVTGVDPSSGMITRAAASGRSGAGCRFLVSSAESLPFETGSFDAVTTAVSVHHWADPLAGLSEVARVLKPGGRLVLGDVAAMGPVGTALRGFRKLDPRHHHGWSLAELGELAHLAGFVAVRGRTASVMGGKVALLDARR